jgi:hypothetical protein
VRNVERHSIEVLHIIEIGGFASICMGLQGVPHSLARLQSNERQAIQYCDISETTTHYCSEILFETGIGRQKCDLQVIVIICAHRFRNEAECILRIEMLRKQDATDAELVQVDWREGGRQIDREQVAHDGRKAHPHR